jgi:hypothetical protein
VKQIESLDKVLQQLESLSLEQLLEFATEINRLVQTKIASLARDEQRKNATGNVVEDDIDEYSPSLSFVKDRKDKEDNSVENVTALIEEWMGEESGYDEETYPQIEAALNQDRVSL